MGDLRRADQAASGRPPSRPDPSHTRGTPTVEDDGHLAELDRPDFDWRTAANRAGVPIWQVINLLRDAHEDDIAYRRTAGIVRPRQVDNLVAHDRAIAREVAEIIDQLAAREAARSR